MRKAGSLLAEVAALLRSQVVVGATPLELDRLAEDEIRARKCLPAFKGYRLYPNTLCVSVNDQVVHGIPNNRPFEGGDIVSIDMGLSYGGLFADMAFTVAIWSFVPDPQGTMLIQATEEALAAGIAAVRPGNRIGDVGFAVQSVAEKYNVSIVRAFAGHGIGRALHSSPIVSNYGREGQGALLKAGMAIAIEPMFTLGTDDVDIQPDGWTAVTKDGSRAAHVEHTVLVTGTGAEILTR
jgi:methionyl aminopeptidase